MSGAPSLDRVTVMTVVMEALLADGARPEGDPDAVDTARIVADGRCVVAGLPVSKEAFGRMGVRQRQFVGRAFGLGGQAPRALQQLAAEHAEHDLGVADIGREQH